MGLFYSDIHSISRGRPQGGVPSPLLWPAFFNPAPGPLRQTRRQRRSGTAEYTDLIYADDVTTVLAADTLRELEMRARRNAGVLRGIPLELGLEPNDQTTCNLLLYSAPMRRGLSKRDLQSTFPTTRKRLVNRHQQESRAITAGLDYDPEYGCIPNPGIFLLPGSPLHTI